MADIFAFLSENTKRRLLSASMICVRVSVVLPFALVLYGQSDPDRCPALARLAIPNVEITSATLTPAGPAGRGGGVVPEHCVVRETIDKRTGFGGKTYAIGFELRLPVKWERRFLFQGGGGMDGLKLGTSPTAESNSIDVLLMLSGLKGYFMYPHDESFDPLKFDFDKDTPRVDDTAALQDPTSTHLSTFIEHGGKILLYHGMADPFFSALNTQGYYERLAKANGGLEKAMTFARYFPVPSMNHCAGGPALDNFDALDAITQWVEQGKAPDRVLVTGAQFPNVSRPLCAWPKHAQYNGTGPRDDAASFTCKE